MNQLKLGTGIGLGLVLLVAFVLWGTNYLLPLF